MAQAAAIVINDGQATPVATTFSPEQVSPALSSFADRATGTALSFRRLKVSTTFASSKSKVNRSKFSLELPIVAVISTVPTLISTMRANVDIIIPDGATDAQRKDLYAFLRNALANTLVQSAMRDLDPLY